MVISNSQNQYKDIIKKLKPSAISSNNLCSTPIFQLIL